MSSSSHAQIQGESKDSSRPAASGCSSDPVKSISATGAPAGETKQSETKQGETKLGGAGKSDHSVHTTDHTTTAQGTWSTKRIAVYALFVALAIALTFVEFPIFPAAPYLKYDPSGIVCLVAGFAFGPVAAAVVSVLSFVPHLVTNPFGAIMAMLVSLGMSLPAALIYKRKRTFSNAVIGLVVSFVVAVAVAILGNIVITPLYSPGVTAADVVGLIVPVLLPFNALKALINALVTLAIYKPVSQLVKKTDA